MCIYILYIIMYIYNYVYIYDYAYIIMCIYIPHIRIIALSISHLGLFSGRGSKLWPLGGNSTTLD